MAFFSVIQYVPDSVRNERINIGVVVLDGSEVVCQFLNNWSRVRQFGGDPTSLKFIAKEIESATADHVLKISLEWQDSIQFTKHAASIYDANSLLVYAAKKFLVDPEINEKAYVTKRDVVQEVKSLLRHAIAERVNRTASKVLRDHPIRGKLDTHQFDIQASNAKPIFAASAISFNVPQTRTLQREIDATAWAIADVKEVNPDMPLSVVYADGNNSFSQHARTVLNGAGANVIAIEAAKQWAGEMADKVAEHLPPSSR